MPPVKRMTANPLRPARHRPGKPGVAASDSSSEEEESEAEEKQEATAPAPAQAPKPKAPPASSFPKSASQIAGGLKKIEISSNEPVSASERRRIEAEYETESEEECEDGSESEASGSEEESEEESSSEDEARRRKLLRPVFIRKKARSAIHGGAASQAQVEDTEWAQEKAKRTTRTDAMIQEQLEKNAQARAEGKTFWDDEKVVDEIDDTDGLDAETELAAWKLRELKRVKRERDALIAAEKEREEIERRRNLTAEEREAEDREHLAKQEEEREGRGKMGFMQKYFHKGAFYTDESKAAGLLDRDVMGGRYVDDVVDRSALPEYMQIRDMTKLGKKGRTRYKDMRSEDTGKFGGSGDKRPRAEGDFRGVDERFKPDHHSSWKGDRVNGATGANTSALGERKRHGDGTEPDGKRIKVD